MSKRLDSIEADFITLPEGFTQPVLFVDDETDLAEILSEIALQTGLSAVCAKNGPEALEKIAAHNPFLIVSDFRMPGLTGLELCKAAKEKGYRGFFTLLTGFADKAMAIQGIDLGVDQLLEKPVDVSTIRGCLLKFTRLRIDQYFQEIKETEEITDLFVDESKELFSDLDSLLLRLEETPPDPAVVDLVFRKIHSVKGGAGAIPNASDLARLSHHLESILSQIKNSKWQPHADALDTFLEAADLCRSLLNLIHSRQRPEPSLRAAVDNCISQLEKLHTSTAIPASSAAPLAASPLSDTKASAESTKTPDEDFGVFVANDKLDSLSHISGEMFVLKNTISMTLKDSKIRSDANKFNQKLHDFLYSFNKVTASLQDQVMGVRKVSLDRALSMLPRLVRQTSREVGKKIHLQTQGFDLGVDRTIAKALSTSLTHMVRNSIDHGIETPEARIERGKEPFGTLSIQAFEKQGVIHILVEDDGCGIDPAKVRKKALDKALISPAEAHAMDDSQVLELIFRPGFSTAESVSSVSGRGVGMDVVRTSVQSLDGRILIDSKTGQGTKFHLQIPVPQTVMIERSLLVSNHGTLMAIPLNSIARIIQASQTRTTKIDSQWTFQHENRTVRLISHECLLPGDPALHFERKSECSIIVMREKNQFLGLVADGIHGQIDAVVSPFGNLISEIPGFRGTTLLGDERVAYVLSPSDFFRLSTLAADPTAA